MASWRLMLLLSLLLAGPSWAGDATNQAWRAEYTLDDVRGARTLLLIRSDDRVEYRIAGEPTRVWQRSADGLEHQEIFVDAARVVTYSPGDLRALGRHPRWSLLSSLIEPQVRSRLQSVGSTRGPGGVAQRYQGVLEGERVVLDWLDAPSLPAHYLRGSGPDRVELILQTLAQVPVERAFTATGDFRELDYADIGDMELDPFARRYILQGAGAARSTY